MNTKHAKRVALYIRVSTSEQTTSNQRRELEAVAERHGWRVVSVFEDAGISGAKGRDKRPGLDSLMKAVARRDVDMVAAWSVELRPGPQGHPLRNPFLPWHQGARGLRKGTRAKLHGGLGASPLALLSYLESGRIRA